MKTIVKIICVLAAMSLGLAACATSVAQGASKQLSVELTDFTFAPDTFTVPAGQEVTLNLKNTGKVEHEFVIIKLGQQVTMPFDDDDEAKVYWEVEVGAGESQSVKFTAPAEPGTYAVVCGQPQHIEAGMKGTLTVVK
jgi:uncharacterized cupredoxin-like copper-binding protein